MPITVQEAGRQGARKQWGPKRHHNIADLAPLHRERVEAFIQAERRAQARENGQPAAGQPGDEASA